MSEQPVRTQALSQAGQALQSLLDTLLREVPEYAEEVDPVHVACAEAPPALNDRPPRPLQETPSSVVQRVPTVRPGWARGEIKVLTVRLGDLRVAFPLAGLAAVIRPGGEGRVLRLPSQPAWHRGVESFRGDRVIRVDPVALLGLATGRRDTAYLLVTAGGRFALEVDALEGPLGLDTETIRWRRRGEGREWVLGVLPEQMTLLLDPAQVTAGLG